MPNMCASLGSLIPGTTLLSLDLNKSANHPVIRQKLHVQTLRKHPGIGQKKRVSAVPEEKKYSKSCSQSCGHTPSHSSDCLQKLNLNAAFMMASSVFLKTIQLAVDLEHGVSLGLFFQK